MEFLIVLIVAVIFGAICYKMAEKRGREEWFGFLMGFLFGWMAVIGYLIAGDTSEKKAWLVADAMEDLKDNKDE